MHLPVAVKDVNERTSWPRLRVWDTYIEDYGNGWRYSIKDFACSGACEWLAVVECVVCCWVGLKGIHIHIKIIGIVGFERRYDPNSIKYEQ